MNVKELLQFMNSHRYISREFLIALSGDKRCELFILQQLLLKNGEEMIEIKDVQIKYGDFIAVDNINIDIKENEFFTFLGPSGCGKTTTLRAIGGFLTPSKGTISINGQVVNDVPIEKRNLGMVFQSYALFPTMTVYDNIAYGLRILKMKESDIKKRVDELARLVNLNEQQLQKNVSNLSGGQQQRVAIARALARKPKIVLFDEPLSNLDAKLRKSLRQELKKIQREAGMTAIYVTHDQEEALEMSDRIAVFNNGYVEDIGTPRQIYNHSATEFVCNFIGSPNLITIDLINEINKQTASQVLDPSKVHYIREEKIKFVNFNKEEAMAEFDIIVEDIIFQGTVINVVTTLFGSHLKIILKDDGNLDPQIGDKLKIYIDPRDIMEYEANDAKSKK